ncbi:MAG: 2-C-methyl-D-erythritol 2,4-cyclodiphosphate synthase [Bacteroidales bacterium]
MIRIGFGYDMHRLAKDETLILGGISIAHELGTVAHSDGDVVIHALCDALLGSLKLRDIGFHFPDTDAEFKNINSTILLSKTYKLVRDKGYSLGNADITICAERPKLNPIIPDMEAVLAKCMDSDISKISIKATTSEKIGFVGREEGIAVYATVLVMNNKLASQIV